MASCIQIWFPMCEIGRPTRDPPLGNLYHTNGVGTFAVHAKRKNIVIPRVDIHEVQWRDHTTTLSKAVAPERFT